jgi:mono/diheme cytochrome c family protein
MPQLNMSDKDAATLADYLSTVMQHPSANPATTDAKQFTAAMATLGKQLYEVKYQCQSCHTIGGTGGYVGPNLNNAGGWLTPAWIEAWLRNPQALVPDSIEPRRNFTDEEINSLTAYLMTLHEGIKPQKTAALESSHAMGQGAGR